MSSWYSSWLSGLPTFDFAVPSSIQRRFFSFLLRRTLGHFLKPGQLDLHQIDSQLGSGTVQVKDLELDNQAINQLIIGLPLSLHDGFISGVTARVPFPNPLSATVGLHVHSLRLTFQVASEPSISPPSTLQNNSNLADSVASVAETFIHDELTPREGATLRQTLKPSTIPSHSVEETESLPGGFNPSAHDPQHEAIRDKPHTDDNPAGVSVFATLIERLLAKFEFSAIDTKVTIVCPGQASFTLSIPEIAYHTHSRPHSETSTEMSKGNTLSGQSHTISICGLKVTSRDLRVAASSPTPSNTLSSASFASSQGVPPPHKDIPLTQSSRSSSSSSLDDDTQLMMSQSIAMLPPNPLHPPSAASSMYQSAVSTEHAPSAATDFPLASFSSLQVTDSIDGPWRAPPLISVSSRDSMEDVLLSFGFQPIVISVQTPPRRLQSSEQIDQVHPEGSVQEAEQETLQLSVTIGTLACAVRSVHLRILLDIVDACIDKLPMTVSQKETSSGFSRAALCLEGNISVRGIVVIALPETAIGEVLSLATFYERPLVPARLPYPYLRLFFDTLLLSFRLSPPSSHTSSSSSGAHQDLCGTEERSTFAKLTISDVSLFTFHSVSSVDDPHTATPILITDPYLLTLDVAHRYRPFASDRPKDSKLPNFEVVDWAQTKLKSGPAKLSAWRSRSRMAPGRGDQSRTPVRRHGDLPGSPNPFISSPLSEVDDRLFVTPAVEVASSSPSKRTLLVDVKIAPLRFFFDLDTIFKDNLLMPFVEDITSATIFTSTKETDATENRNLNQQSTEESSDVYVEDDGHVQQRSLHAKQREEERKRLEALVLEDLDLEIDYRRTTISKPKSSRQQSTSSKQEKITNETGLGLRAICPMIRVEVRTPPPPRRLPRSGCMLLDFRGLRVSNDVPSTKSSLRFSVGTDAPSLRSNDSIPNAMLSVRLQEILVAYSPVGSHVAHAILTLGFLPGKEVGPETGVLLSTETEPDTLPLSVVVGRPRSTQESLSNSSRKLAMNLDIPLVNLVMDKVVFDGLQCWADDVAQLIERIVAAQNSATETLSRTPSLIGSRYFAQLRRSGTHSTVESIVAKPNNRSASEAVVKVAVTEVLLRFMIPRNGESRERPLDVLALDVDALIELKTEGKDKTVITSAIMDLRVADTSNEGDYVLLVHSPDRSLSSMPRPSVKAQITSLVIPETTAKESRIKLSFWGLTARPPLEGNFGSDLAAFAKAPPGVFESVVPSECTRLTVGVADVSVQLCAPRHPGAAALHLGEVEFSTELVGNSSESAFKLSILSLHIFLVDSIQDALGSTGTTQGTIGRGVDFWKKSGYALIAEISDSRLAFRTDNATAPPHTNVVIERIGLRIHLCADTIGALTGLITSLTRTLGDDTNVRCSEAPARAPNAIVSSRNDMTASLDENAFRLVPEVGSTADMISDDLPANQDYLDASFGTAAGLRELRDDDLDDFDMEERTDHDTPVKGQLGIVSNVGGETVRILKPFSFVEHHFDTISPEAVRDPESDSTLRIRIHNSDVALFLHDGFDWPRTRKIIEKEVKDMRKRLARIRQLVATGQTQEPIDDATSATLFNSFHIGLERDLDTMDPDTLVAAIDDELDDAVETGTESSWQSLHTASPGRPRVMSAHVHGKRLTRSRAPSIEIRLEGLSADIDNYPPGGTLVSRTLILVRDLEILDHIKTSTWKKFLTDMRSDSRGNVRETDSDMIRVELLSVRPSPSHLTEEARLRAKILPLRLYVDQDALDFFKKFFAFQDPDSPSLPEDVEKEEIYFQHAEVFPVDIKLDYKPRRVDYKALRNGRTIELMNFFHFDGAEMTLRHLTLHGITGWPRFFDTLNDLWTPDVKATQLVDVISGVAPIRSVVNVGSGVADLVLLPIAQYKRDGRIVRGVQKGTKAFVQSTAMEAIKLGARLATGTQVILEKAENVLGGQFTDPITAEALQIPYENEDAEVSDEDLISRYAAQPAGLKEGVQSAYRSLQRNLHSAAQTILAVPMEIYERSGDEGAVRAVVRAVPIAVLKPMIGASEAVSKTLMGLHNTLDPNIRLENEAKYKHR